MCVKESRYVWMLVCILVGVCIVLVGMSFIVYI